jgi:nuclear transport factor 2 (NTF2) superfamily protein
VIPALRRWRRDAQSKLSTFHSWNWETDEQGLVRNTAAVNEVESSGGKHLTLALVLHTFPHEH